VQESFIIKRNKYILTNIYKILENIDYDLIISSITYNKKDTQWDKQIGWTEMYDIKETILPKIEELTKSTKHIVVKKLTRSIFKADEDIIKILNNNNIEEIHIV